MFGRTGQMFPRRAYHDAIYEEEYGSETEEDCCRGRGLSAILCWFLSVIVLIGVAASVVLTVFFILKSRSTGSGLDELNLIFDQDTGFSAVPTPPAQIPPFPSSASTEEDEPPGTSSFSSSSRRPPVYVDSNEYRYRGSSNSSSATGSSPQYPSPSTFSTRNSGSSRMTTRKYYSDTTDQSLEDVISETTPIPPTTTSKPNNVFKFLMNTIKTFQNSDEFTPSQSASESMEKSILPTIHHTLSSEEGDHAATVTRPPQSTYDSKSHGTTLFTSAPSSGGKASKPRNKANKPFILYPTDGGERLSSSSSSEELVDGSTMPPPTTFHSNGPEDDSRYLELPSPKKVPAGLKPSVQDYTTSTTTTTSALPTTSRSEDMLTKIILRNKNTAGGTTKRTFFPTTIPPKLYPDSSPETSKENESKEDNRRPGKARTVIYKTTTTAIPSNLVLVTPTTTESSSEESMRNSPPLSSPTSSIEALDHPRHDTTKSPPGGVHHHPQEGTSSGESSEESSPSSTHRPKGNQSNEFLDILVGSDDTKTLVTKQTDSGIITSAMLPPWFNSDGDGSSSDDSGGRTRNESTQSSPRKPELFRQPDLTALLDILSAPDGNNSAKSETYNEMNTEASQKAERLKHLEEEFKPIFSSPSASDHHESHKSKFSPSYPHLPNNKDNHQPARPPQSIGAPATNSFHYPMDDGKTNIYGFFPDDDLEGEESAEQLQIEISPNRPPPPKNVTDYDNSSEQSEDDHIIDIAYDSKTRPEIQLELGGDSLEESDEQGPTRPQQHSQQSHHFGQRAPLHGSNSQDPSYPAKPPPTPPAPPHNAMIGDIPSASETTNAVQPPPSPPPPARPSAEEEYESDKHDDWSVKTPSSNQSTSNLPLNSLEEYSDEDPNYALASIEAAELNLEREKDKVKDTPPPPTTPSPTTQKPKTKVIQVFSEPYVPTKDTPLPDKSTSLPPEEYEYSAESPESNKTGFNPPEPISFHESPNSFQTPEYNSKDGWRPLVVDRRGNSDISDLKPSGSVKFRGSTPPSSTPASPPQTHRAITTPLAAQSSEYHEYEVEGLPQSQPQDSSWTGVVPSFNNNLQSPSVNMVPPPPRMKFPEPTPDRRPTIKVPQPQNQRPHHIQHGIDRSKYMQRPAVPPIIMRRLPQIQQNPTQNSRGDPSLNQNPSIRMIHRGPQFLPNMSPAPNIRPGPPGPAPTNPGNVQWPSEGQNNAIRRNSHYLMNQRRQG